MVTKTKFPGICNNCGKRSEFIIRCGIHTLQVCCTCLRTLRQEILTTTCAKDDDQPEYNNSVETGLIKPRSKS